MREDTLVVDDRDYLVALQLAMGESFGVGVWTLLTMKWCVENGPRPVGGGG